MGFAGAIHDQQAGKSEFARLVVLEKFIPRSELNATERGKKIAAAVRLLASRITRASKALEDFGVSEDELRELANRKICERIAELGG